MPVHFSRGRLYVGLRRKDWAPVWYEPMTGVTAEGEITKPEDLTEPNVAPDLALYNTRKKGTESDPMEGEVAWEPLFDPSYQESSKKPERMRMQKMILYDAWRYLESNKPADIAKIRKQLAESDPRRKALVRECEKARKMRSRPAGRVRRDGPFGDGGAVPSIEDGPDSDSDSDSGSDSGYGGGAGGVSGSGGGSGGGGMGPPPSISRKLFGGPGGSPSHDFPMSGARGGSMATASDADDLEVVRPGRFSASAASVKTPSTASSSSKRKAPSSASLPPNSRPRTGPRLGGLLFPTPGDSQRPGRNLAGDADDDILNNFGAQDINAGLDETAAFARAVRNSEARGEDQNVQDANGGLDQDEAERIAIRNSMVADPLRNAADNARFAALARNAASRRSAAP